MGIKIAMIKGEDDKDHVPPQCMKLLLDFAGHRDVCDECHDAFKYHNLNYCVTGKMILEELCKQPEVSYG